MTDFKKKHGNKTFSFNKEEFIIFIQPCAALFEQVIYEKTILP